MERLIFSTNNTNINVSGNIVKTGGTWTAGAGDLTLDGSLSINTNTGTNLGNVIVDNLITLSSDIGTANLTINSNDTVVTSGYELDINGMLDLNGTLDASNGTDGNTTISIAGDWDMTGGMFISTNSTIAFDSAANDQNITSAGLSFNNLVLNNTAAGGSDDIILVDALDVNGTLTITDGDLDANTNNIDISLFGNWIMGANGSFDEGTHTVTFDNTAADQFITSDGEAFYNIVLNNSGAPPNDDLVLVDSLDVDGTLRITDGDLDSNTNDQNISVAGNWLIDAGGSFDAGTSTVTFDSTSAQTITTNAQSFINIDFNGVGGSWELQDALDINGSLALSNGTLDVNGANNFAVNVAGNLYLTSGSLKCTKWNLYLRRSGSVA